MAESIYHIHTLPADTDIALIKWGQIPVARVDQFRWLAGYAPETTAQMVYVEGLGFVLRMECAETEPRAVYRQYMDPVYTDSCLEFFADWLGDGRYINMEMNANGTLLSCIGTDRHARTPIAEMTEEGYIFPVSARRLPDRWYVLATVPTDLLAAILGVPEPEVGPGFTFRGNFYKCGDDTAIPHYGMWSPVETEAPDFHRPEFFGTLVVDAMR